MSDENKLSSTKERLQHLLEAVATNSNLNPGSIEQLRRLRNHIAHLNRYPSEGEYWVIYKLTKEAELASRRAKRWASIRGALNALAAAFDRRGKIVRPPGMRLNAIAEFLFAKNTYERVFQPTIADLQREYLDALAQDRLWKARWIWLRGHYSFWVAFLCQLPISWMRLVFDLWKAAGS
jgi:hypothetical protein